MLFTEHTLEVLNILLPAVRLFHQPHERENCERGSDRWSQHSSGTIRRQTVCAKASYHTKIGQDIGLVSGLVHLSVAANVSRMMMTSEYSDLKRARYRFIVSFVRNLHAVRFTNISLELHKTLVKVDGCCSIIE